MCVCVCVCVYVCVCVCDSPFPPFQLDEDVLGRNARTVFRDQSGRRRDLAAEATRDAEEARVKAEQEAARKEKYDKWGKG